jgi:hypothetical protein
VSLAFPYRTPSDEAVQAGAWLLLRNDKYSPVPPLLSEWDCGTDLSFRREIVLDRFAFADETGLAENEMRLELIVQWRVSDSLLTGIAYRAALEAGATSVTADFTLRGRELGGTLQLTTAILLSASQSKRDGPVARHVGSILWRSVKRVRLTGDASRLPITKVDFKQQGLDEFAPWTVQIVGDVETPAMGAVQLLLNTRRDDVIHLLEGRTEHDDAARAVRSALYVAVGRALLEYAVLDEDLSEDAEYDDDMLGSVLLGQLRLRFPGRSLGELRALRENEPARFSALVDGRYRLFDLVTP